jgi:hypothetical protein
MSRTSITSEFQSRLTAFKYPTQKIQAFHGLVSTLYKNRNQAAIDAIRAFDFSGLVAEISEVNTQRMGVVEEYRVKLNEAKKAIQAIFGEKSKEYRYVKALSTYSEPQRLEFPDRLILEVEREMKNRAVDSELVISARRYLAQKGDTEILTDAQAVAKAADIRYSELIDEQPDEVDISCCDYCGTWNRHERRCSCGNRRIGWEYSGKDPEKMYIYPMAY